MALRDPFLLLENPSLAQASGKSGGLRVWEPVLFSTAALYLWGPSPAGAWRPEALLPSVRRHSCLRRSVWSRGRRKQPADGQFSFLV